MASSSEFSILDSDAGQAPGPRLLHVTTGLTTGGAETMLLRLVSATNSDFQHTVLSLKDEGTIGLRIRELGVPVHSLDLHPRLPNPLRAFRIRSLIRHLQPNLIQGWMYHGNVAATMGAAGMGIPVIWNVQQSVTNMVGFGRLTAGVIRLGAFLSERPAIIIYASRIGAKQHAQIGFHPASAVVIPNAIDCENFRRDPVTRSQIRNELGFNDEHVVIGVTARFHPMKDHVRFLTAAGIVARKHPEARFVLAGTNVTLEQRSLRRVILEEQLQERVALLGERSDIPRVLASLDIACSSSAWGEAFSLAIGEAMASGVPCVVTDVGDSAYMVAETGIVVPPADSEALAKALLQMMEAGPERRRELGLAARHRAEKEFSLPEIARRYAAIYRDCLVEAPAK